VHRQKEHSSRLNNIYGSCTGPVNVGRVTLIEDGDLVSIDVEELAIFLHLTLELVMGGVILDHVDHVVKKEGVIECFNMYVKNMLIIYLLISKSNIWVIVLMERDLV